MLRTVALLQQQTGTAQQHRQRRLQDTDQRPGKQLLDLPLQNRRWHYRLQQQQTQH
jgi:hypothetical protein